MSATEMTQEEPSKIEIKSQLSFKDYKGFKEVNNIRDIYKMGKELGAGSFGAVSLATQKATGRKVAIKVVSKQKLE